MTTSMAIADATDLAYERAFQDHWSDVFRFALAWTNDWAAAEDLAQEAYLRLWDRRRSIDWADTVLPWLLVTTRRLATDRFRQLRRRLSGLPSGASQTLDPGVQARWLDVRAALDRLSPTERSALVMTTLEGRSSEEAATVIGTSPGAVRAAVSRARAKLENA